MYEGTFMDSRRHGLGFERSFAKKSDDTTSENGGNADKKSNDQSESANRKTERRIYGEWKKGKLIRTFDTKAEAIREVGDAYKFLLETPELSEFVNNLPEPDISKRSRNGNTASGTCVNGDSMFNGVRSRPNKKKK